MSVDECRRVIDEYRRVTRRVYKNVDECTQVTRQVQTNVQVWSSQ